MIRNGWFLCMAVVVACGGGSGGEAAAPDAVAEAVADAPGADAPGGEVVKDTLPDTIVTPDEGVQVPDTAHGDLAKPETAQDLPPAETQASCPVFAGKGSKCSQAAACAVLCLASDAWLSGCKGELASDQVTNFDGLMQCLGGLDTPALDGEIFSDGARQACGPQIDACFAGTGNCKEIWICRKKCSAEDPACPMACQGIGDAAAQAAWNEYVKCVFGVECAQTEVLPNGWPTETCEGGDVRIHCSLKYQACMGI